MRPTIFNLIFWPIQVGCIPLQFSVQCLFFSRKEFPRTSNCEISALGHFKEIAFHPGPLNIAEMQH